MGNTFWVFAAAVAPVVIMLYYIFRKDKYQQEPVAELVKAFFMGVGSVFISLMISIPLINAGIAPDEPTTVWGCVATSFFGAAIPEEIAKFVMLWLLLRRSKYFDERMDGIVYAVYVSLGFAALENVMYLFMNYDEWLAVGISRAIFSIPGHFGFGVLMGYYYSLQRFYPSHRDKKALVLIAPILAHGVFDSILFMTDVLPAISGLLMLLFILFCRRMWKKGKMRIEQLLQSDRYQSEVEAL